jgi:AraC-like DNA-binding protein
MPPGEHVGTDARPEVRPGHRRHPAALADRTADTARAATAGGTGDTIDYIAGRCGFGNASALRHHFRIWRGTTPHAYRRMFQGADPPTAAHGEGKTVLS